MSCESRIDRGHLLRLVRYMLRVPSDNPPGLEAAVASFIFRYLESLGASLELVSAQKDRPNVIATLDFGPGPTLLMVGHMDTAPPGEGWTVDPYGAEVTDGKVFGRGATDSKGGLSAMLSAARTMVREADRFRGRLVQVYAVDEEMGGSEGIGHLVRNCLIGGDAAIVCEPTDLRVVVGEGAMLWLDVEITGRAGHSVSHLSEANPVEGMLDFTYRLLPLAERVRGQRGRGGQGVFSVNVLSGGFKTNVVPSRCRCGIDVRLPCQSEVDAGDVLAALMQAAADARLRHPQLEVTVSSSRLPGFSVPESELIVRLAGEAVSRVTGRSVEDVYVKESLFSSDLSYLWREAGIPGVCLGPGTPSRAHTADESVAIRDLEQAADILLLVADGMLGKE